MRRPRQPGEYLDFRFSISADMCKVFEVASLGQRKELTEFPQKLLDAMIARGFLFPPYPQDLRAVAVYDMMYYRLTPYGDAVMKCLKEEGFIKDMRRTNCAHPLYDARFFTPDGKRLPPGKVIRYRTGPDGVVHGVATTRFMSMEAWQQEWRNIREGKRRKSVRKTGKPVPVQPGNPSSPPMPPFTYAPSYNGSGVRRSGVQPERTE